jgi:hypothetical protein
VPTPLTGWRFTARALLVRLRFPLLVGGVVLLLAAWPWLRNHWDHLTRRGTGIDTSISGDTEYWCPMCPGVLSAWPEKCPVCHMALVRRKKGEATPLPDGVVARMQLSPYRVQLAGVRTTVVEYRPLAWEATLAGRVEAPGQRVAVEVPEGDAGNVRPGAEAVVECEAYPGRPFPARVAAVASEVSRDTLAVRVQLDVADEKRELRAGMYVTVRLRVPLTQLPASMRSWRDEIRDRTAVELAVQSLPAFATPAPGLRSLLEAAGRLVMQERGLTLAIPESSVIDTGDRRVVFVETMPGMFDAVEVTVGRRCGDYYPVLRGLTAGQRVVTAGAFLLDAETRLNPALAGSYFGAGRSRPVETPAEKPTDDDERLIARQKLCPVTDEPLGSMGKPVRVVVEGRPVFLCCKGCDAELKRDPKTYLAKLPR